MKFFPWQIFRSINKKNQNKSLRPKFHFSTPKGWCNDPNGFSQFGDKIHLFFQHHPYSTQWGPMHWGHVVTSDMLTWEQLPIALAPDTTADCKGCFSGTAQEKDGHFYMICVLKQKDDKGAMVMFESEEAENWKYKGIVDFSKDGLSKMWEKSD